MSLILGASVIASAQTQIADGGPFPRRGSAEYWLMVDAFADRTVHFAYVKHFAQLHEQSLTDRQCEQYSRLAVDYRNQLAAIGRAGVSAKSEFWREVRAYSIHMIGPPGVPIPVHRSSNYWVTTGSEAEDQELRRIVSLEIDEAGSHLIPTSEYSPSAANPECRAGEEPIANAQP
jgi:hypothetical protein